MIQLPGLGVRIDGDASGLGKAFQQANSHLGAFQQSVRQTSQHTESFFGRMAATAGGFLVANAAMGAMGTTLGFVRQSFIGYNATIQNTRTALTSVLGSVDAADQSLRQLADLAKTSPFEFKDLARLGPQLLQVGFGAQDLIPIFTAVGNSLSSAGQMNAEALNSVIRALTQMAARGKISTEEILQMSEAGVPALRILADGFGVSTAKMQQMVTDGLVPADRGIKVLTDGMNKNKDAMEKASKTFTGAMSTLRDSANETIGGRLKPLFDLLTEGINVLNKAMASPTFQRYGQMLERTVAGLAAVIRAFATGDAAALAKATQTLGQSFNILRMQIEVGMLKAVQSIAPHLGSIGGMFAQMTVQMAVWGARLMGALAEGILAGAAAAVRGALIAVGEMIASFFRGQSPPKEGPLKEIDDWGANLLTTLLAGMTNADFSVLDQVGKAIQDALAIQLQAGTISEEGVIPRLIGSKTAVAEAIKQLREVGNVSEDVMDRLRGFLGDAADSVIGLTTEIIELGRQEAALDALNDQIDDMDDLLRDVERQYKAMAEPIKDRIRDIEKMYDTEIDKIDDTVTALDKLIEAREKSLRPNTAILDLEEAALEVAVNRERILEAENAHLERARKLRQEIADIDERIAKARGEGQEGESEANAALAKALRDERSKKDGGDPQRIADLEAAAAKRVSDVRERSSETINKLTADRATLETRLATEGVQSDKDRLALVQARLALVQSEAESRTLSDDELAGWKTTKEAAEDQREAVKDMKDNAIRPLRDDLDFMTDAYEGHRETIERMRDGLIGQRDAMEEQRDRQAEIVETGLTRLAQEREVSDLIGQQAALLERMRKEAEAAAKGGAGGAGGGAGGAGLAGVGSLAGLLGGAGGAPIKLEAPVFDWGQVQTNLKASLEKERDRTAAAVKDGLKDGISTGITKAFEEAFKDPRTGSVLSVGLVGMFVGGPAAGAFLAGAATLGLKLGDMIADAIRSITGEGTNTSIVTAAGMFGPWLVDKLGESFTGTIDGLIDALGLVLDGLATWVTEELPKIGKAIIDGLWAGIKDNFHSIIFVDDILIPLFNTIKGWLGIDSPSSRMRDEVGKPIIEGMFAGMKAAWDAGFQWLVDLPGNVLSSIGNVTTTLAEAGKTLLQGLFHGMGDKMTASVEWLGGLKDTIKGHFGNVTTTLTSVGSDLMSGLISGISSGWERVKAYIGGLKDQLPDWFKALWKIGSPSRVMRDEVGIPLAQGIAQGIDEGLPLVIDMVHKLRGAIGEAFTGSSGGSGGGGGGGDEESQRSGFETFIYFWNRAMAGGSLMSGNIWGGASGPGVMGNRPIPMMAEGGITLRDTLAQLHANEAVIPLDRLTSRLPAMVPALAGGGGGAAASLDRYQDNSIRVYQGMDEAKVRRQEENWYYTKRLHETVTGRR